MIIYGSTYKQIVLFDGTYKLLKNILTLMVFFIDSNEQSEISGVGLVKYEDKETFT